MCVCVWYIPVGDSRREERVNQEEETSRCFIAAAMQAPRPSLGLTSSMTRAHTQRERRAVSVPLTDTIFQLSDQLLILCWNLIQHLRARATFPHVAQVNFYLFQRCVCVCLCTCVCVRGISRIYKYAVDLTCSIYTHTHTHTHTYTQCVY